MEKEEEKRQIELEKKFNASALATSLPDSTAFDESCFDFALITGETAGASEHMHTQVIFATATYKYGEHAGSPVPLQCTWYNVMEDSNGLV